MRIECCVAVTRTTVQSCCVLIVALGGACSRKSSSGQSFGVASASVSASAGVNPGRPKLSCKSSGTSFSVGPVDLQAKDDDDEPQAVQDLPFAVTLGNAVAHPHGYLVTAIDAREGGSHAVLAWLDRDVSRGSLLDLGRVYGDAEPPRVILRGEDGFFVVSDTDASGKLYRYGWIRGLPSQPRVDWLSSFEQAIDGSPAYALAGSDDSIVVTWDELDRETRRSRVLWATLDKSGHPSATIGAPPSHRKSERNVTWAVQSTAREIDAEAPQIVAVASGYWLSYVAGEGQSPAPTKAALSPHEPHAMPAGTNDDEVRVVDLGRRGIWLIPLDARGQLKSKHFLVTPRGARVVTYDVEAAADGGVIVAYRDGDATPGVEAQTIELVRIRADGSIERHRIDDERVGAGMPLLLADDEVGVSTSGGRSVWVSFASSTGETKLAELSSVAAPTLEVVEETNLAGVDLLLRRGNSLLVARHRARLVSFERMDCIWPDGRSPG